jgi:hypothetical protein
MLDGQTSWGKGNPAVRIIEGAGGHRIEENAFSITTRDWRQLAVHRHLELTGDFPPTGERLRAGTRPMTGVRNTLFGKLILITDPTAGPSVAVAGDRCQIREVEFGFAPFQGTRTCVVPMRARTDHNVAGYTFTRVLRRVTEQPDVRQNPPAADSMTSPSGERTASSVCTSHSLRPARTTVAPGTPRGENSMV